MGNLQKAAAFGKNLDDDDDTSMEATHHTSHTYKWPDNVHDETRDMASLVVLINTLASALQFDYPSDSPKTPSQIKALVQHPYNDNPLISKVFHDVYQMSPKLLYQFLDGMEENGIEVHYNNKNSTKLPMAYAVCKDSTCKRITLVLRGETLKDGSNSVWLKANKKLDAPKTQVSIPLDLGERSTLRFHSQFYGHLFDPGLQKTTTSTRYSEMVESIKSLLQDCPDYKVYVTGHGMGAALATIVAFYLTVDASIPKPVTCVNFASPRVGDGQFLQATKALEQRRKLRFLRVVHENDAMTNAPIHGYHHVGFQITLHEGNHEPLVSYPKQDNLFLKFQRAFQNSPLHSWNFEYNQYEYREAIEKDAAFLQELNLNEMYKSVDLTGFDEQEEQEGDLVHSSVGE